MKKVLRLTGTRKLLQNELAFKQAAQKLGDIDIDFVCYLDLFFDIDGQFKFISNGEPLKDYDYYWCGGLKALSFKNAILYHYMHLLGKKLIDPRIQYTIDNSKLSQIVLLKHLNISIPQSLFFVADQANKKQLKSLILERFSYPFILKNPLVDRGEGVFLIKTEADLDKHLSQSDFPSFLVQEFIENDGDFRVLTTKSGILGVIKRSNEKDFRNNISAGGKSELIKHYPEKVKQISKQILEEYGLDIAGIDFFIKGEECFVIEINDLPQYAGFEQATGLSYAQEVLSYIKNL